MKPEVLNHKAFSKSVEAKKAFLKDLQSTLQTHQAGNDYIKYKFSKTILENEKDINNFPFIHVNLFKYYSLQSCPDADVVLRLTSSGIGGQKSQMLLDKDSLDNVKQMAYNVYDELGMVSEKKYNYICFTYDPAVANDLGTAFTDELLTSFTQKNEVFYTFQHNGDEFFFEKEKTLEKLKEFSQSEYPLRILGFPAFLYDLITENDIELNFGKDSWLLTGGGWKGRSTEEIPKDKFKNLVHKHLGIPQENVRDLFGMVEHGIPYVECSKGKFRIPNYSRVIVRDHKTLEPLGYGQVGLLQFICAYNTSNPTFSYLGTDKGMILESSDELGDELVLMGRAGVSKHKGCALKALELMK